MPVVTVSPERHQTYSAPELAHVGQVYRPECSCGWISARTFRSRPAAQRATIAHVQECQTGRTVALSAVEARRGRLEGYAEDAELVAEARGWLADCTWADVDGEDIAELSAAEVLLGVQRHYVGGVDAFAAEVIS